MKHPCIAIDVSKESSHIQGFYALNDLASTPILVSHDSDGFSMILDLKKSIYEDTDKEVIVVFEDTGVYDKPLQMFLKNNGIRYVRVNPLVSARHRKKDLRAVKTDRKDCSNIAKVYYNESLEYHLDQDDYYTDLRHLNRYYEESIDHLRKYKVNFKESLDVVWPMFNKEFSDIFKNVPLKIIEFYGHPHKLKRAKHKTISKFIMKNSNHRQTWSEKKALKLLQYANSVEVGCSESDINVKTLKDRVHMICINIRKTDELRNQIIEKASIHSNFRLLMSIPGIGENTASRLVAEIGDISRFDNPRQLVAYAGIDPQVYESGKYVGKFSISKKGNKRLRSLLYLVSRFSLRKTAGANSINEYYKRKTQQGKPSKVVLIACCNKLIRIIYSMCLNGTLYEYQV